MKTERHQLKQENKELKVTEGEMEDYLARMEEKNKELKRFKSKVFNLIDKKIKEAEKICFLVMRTLRSYSLFMYNVQLC